MQIIPPGALAYDKIHVVLGRLATVRAEGGTSSNPGEGGITNHAVAKTVGIVSF